MENVRNWFENNSTNSGEHYSIFEYEGHLEANTNIAIFMIVAPHEGTKNKWMLRVSPSGSFDRWANSTAVEEFFDTDTELCSYLNDHQLEIYKALLVRLSRDYDELYTAFEES